MELTNEQNEIINSSGNIKINAVAGEEQFGLDQFFTLPLEEKTADGLAGWIDIRHFRRYVAEGSFNAVRFGLVHGKIGD